MWLVRPEKRRCVNACASQLQQTLLFASFVKKCGRSERTASGNSLQLPGNGCHLSISLFVNPIVAPICTSIVCSTGTLLEGRKIILEKNDSLSWCFDDAESEALSTYQGNCLLCVDFFEGDAGCCGGRCRHFCTDDHLAYFPLSLLLLTWSPPQLFHLWSL